MPQKHRYLLSKIPNDQEGQDFIDQFKRYLNKGSYSVTLRGNGPRAKVAREEGIYARSYDQSIPLEKSEHFRVYINKK